MRRLLALLALLSAVSASAGTGALTQSLGIDFAALQAVPQRPPAGETYAAAPGSFGAPVQTIPLAPLLDGVRATKASFKSGSTVVHVFGGKSQNKKNWFVGFLPEGGEAQFREGRKMIHWVMINRTVHFEIAGRRYSAYIEGKATDKLQSRLIVAPEDKSEGQSSWSVDELSGDALDAGAPVSIGGKNYRLMYTRDFNEDENGEFAGYTGDRSITLMTREGDKLIGYHWFEREIPADHILLSTPKAAGADASRPGSFTIGLRLNAGALEIYSPSR